MLKMIPGHLLLSVLALASLNTPALAHQKYSKSQTCYKNKYTETYHPGTRQSKGFVTSKEIIVPRPCPKNFHSHGKKTHKHKMGRVAHDHHSHQTSTIGTSKLYAPELNVQDTNSCIEGTVAGGVLGAAMGGALAKKENWIWSIPAGAVGGAIVGCQIDGG
tara:strand:- start:105 stop:587 length:483 start_codon:yes stop_codon:yes gene_type:complete